MREQVNRIISILSGSRKEYSLDHRVFNVLCLLTSILTFFSLLANSIMDINIAVIAVSGIVMVSCFGFYLYSRIRKSFRLLVWPMVFLAYFAILPAWFLNGGTRGATQYIYFAAMAVSLVIVNMKTKIFVIILYTGTTIALPIIEYYNKSLIAAYGSPLVRYIDILITFPITLLIIGSGFIIMLNNYRDLHYKLKTTNEKLTVKNHEIENDIIMAKKIQQQFIPLSDPTPYIHALYKPVEHVGGDYFDFVKFRDSKNIGIFISDVSGHGVQGAFITSMIKSNLQHAGLMKENPAELLEFLNIQLFDTIYDNFITAFYGIFNPDDGTLRYANAGHMPPVVISGNTVKELSGKKGPPLAIADAEDLKKMKKEYSNNETQIDPASKLLLYTDGVTEAIKITGESENFEYKTMKRVLIAKSTLNCKKFVSAIFEEMVLFRGSETFDDDICLICVDV